EKFVRTGADRGADGIILDLEDAVAPSEKERARTLIADAIPQVARKGADVLVRVNRPWRLLVRDLEAAVIPGVAALMLTKVDSPEHVQAAADIVDELEAERGLQPGAIQFVVLVASAIHPLQVPVLNEEFSPTEAEVDRAQRMIAAYDTAFAEGLGAVQFEGAMIDVPVVQRAKNVLARAAAIRRRSQISV